MSYKFKVGDKGKTRYGIPYRVICTDVRSPSGVHSVMALLTRTTGYEVQYCYTEDGCISSRGASIADLMPPTVTKWLNVWLHGKGNTPHSQLHVAKQHAEAAAEQYSAGTNITYLVIAQPVEVQES